MCQVKWGCRTNFMNEIDTHISTNLFRSRFVFLPFQKSPLLLRLYFISISKIYMRVQDSKTVLASFLGGDAVSESLVGLGFESPSPCFRLGSATCGLVFLGVSTEGFLSPAPPKICIAISEDIKPFLNISTTFNIAWADTCWMKKMAINDVFKSLIQSDRF